MSGLDATIDPDATPLALSRANGIDVLTLRVPAAEDTVQWVSSASTEGELPAGARPSNQQIPMKLRIYGSDAATFAAVQRAVDQKLQKLQREGGVLRLVFPGLDTIDWEIVKVSGGDRLLDNRFMRHFRTEDEITFICRPYGRGREYEVPLALERDTPALITRPFTVKGDVDALGRLQLRNEGTEDIRWLRWGREAQNLSTATTAGLHYDGASMTPLGTASVVGTAIRQGALVPGWVAFLSTELAGVGSMTHVGVFEVRARIAMPTTNRGEVQLALEYWTGDGTQRMRNAPVIFAADHARQGQQITVSLGEIRLRPAGLGPHRWHGQIIARSTVFGDDLDAVALTFIPLEEGNGTLAATAQPLVATAPFALDGFEQPAGALAGNSAPLGGRWVEEGATGGFTISGGANRTAITPGVTSPRYATLDAVSAADMDLSWSMWLDYTTVIGVTQGGALLRYADASNHIRVGVSSFTNDGGHWRTFFATVLVAGNANTISWGDNGQTAGMLYGLHRFRLTCVGQRIDLEMDGIHVLRATIPTPGVPARGRVGFWDWSNRARTRIYGNLLGTTGGQTQDAVAFAARSVELRSDAIEREAADGGAWGDVADRRGDYLTLTPSGMENRRNRIIAVPATTDPETGADLGQCRLSARLYVTPRYRTIPDPA